MRRKVEKPSIPGDQIAASLDVGDAILDGEVADM